jgi:subtilisin family serine protease
LGVAIGAATAVVAGVLVALPGTASAAPRGTVITVLGATAVPDSYIVVLRDAATARSATPRTARELTRRYGGQVRRTWSRALHGFSARMSADQASALAADPRVAYVQADSVVHLADVEANPPSYGLDRIDQRDLPLDRSYTTTVAASGVHAYIIDTGIRVTHETFGGRATFGHNSVDANDTDCHGHGTHVAGTVGGAEYGVAKDVALVAVKVLDCKGSGTTAQVVDGVDWVTQNAIRPAVANMSLGGAVNDAIDGAVSEAIASGVTFAIAAGNDNTDACGQSPARVPNAITVNASDRVDLRATFSNFGTCTDIFAPGVKITSAWATSDTATNTISGTSMATPHVTGAAALWLAAHPADMPEQVSAGLTGTATPGRVGDAGDGSPNLLLYTGTGPVPPPPPPPVCTGPGQRLVNPGFESGTRGWLATSGVFGNGEGEVAHSGTRYAWLSGYGRPHTDRMQQVVTVPAGCVKSVLTFWLHVDTDEVTTTIDYDILAVQAGTSRVLRFSNLDESAGYVQHSMAVGQFAGQTITVSFAGTEDEDSQTSFVVDDTALTAS